MILAEQATIQNLNILCWITLIARVRDNALAQKRNLDYWVSVDEMARFRDAMIRSSPFIRNVRI
jgi:hypothetical protein